MSGAGASGPTDSRRAAPSVLVLHGPNLNLLGTREPELYGSTTLADVQETLTSRATSLGVRLESLQSNHEGVLIDRIQAALDDGTRALIINPGGLTHTSVSLRDAVAAVRPRLPVIEVHLTVREAREPFRHLSLLAGVVSGRISGFGAHGYIIAFDAALGLIRPST